MAPFKPGQVVHYEGSDGTTVSAKVERAHRDGTVTVEAHFLLNAAGVPSGKFLGQKYRLRAEALTQVAEAA